MPTAKLLVSSEVILVLVTVLCTKTPFGIKYFGFSLRFLFNNNVWCYKPFQEGQAFTSGIYFDNSSLTL